MAEIKQNKELEEVRKRVMSWFESYKGWGDEMAVEMFVDDLEIVEPYVRRLYDMRLIDRDEYFQFLAFCETLVEELKKIAGIERIDWSFR